MNEEPTTPQEIEEDLRKYYAHLYVCSVCGKMYGADKKENPKRIKKCPRCKYNSFNLKNLISKGEDLNTGGHNYK